MDNRDVLLNLTGEMAEILSAALEHRYAHLKNSPINAISDDVRMAETVRREAEMICLREIGCRLDEILDAHDEDVGC